MFTRILEAKKPAAPCALLETRSQPKLKTTLKLFISLEFLSILVTCVERHSRAGML